jgi:elongation factor P--beta-lysine ligase
METEYSIGTSVFVYNTTRSHKPEFHNLDYYYVFAKVSSNIGSIAKSGHI